MSASDPESPEFYDLASGRWLLERESRWRREFRHVDGRHHFVEGLIGTTDKTPSLEELRSGWLSWTSNDRRDFCDVLCTVPCRTDLSDILIFIWENGSSEERALSAIILGARVAPDIALPLLLEELERATMQHAIPLLAGLSELGQPDCAPAIRARLQRSMDDSSVWDLGSTRNYAAHAALFCIRTLLEFGSAPAEFADLVKRFSLHSSKEVRNDTSFFLSRWYDWLPGWHAPG